MYSRLVGLRLACYRKLLKLKVRVSDGPIQVNDCVPDAKTVQQTTYGICVHYGGNSKSVI